MAMGLHDVEIIQNVTDGRTDRQRDTRIPITTPRSWCVVKRHTDNTDFQLNWLTATRSVWGRRSITVERNNACNMSIHRVTVGRLLSKRTPHTTALTSEERTD